MKNDGGSDELESVLATSVISGLFIHFLPR